MKRQAYLVTWSRANTTEYDKKRFAEAVTSAFAEVTSSLIKHWCCCVEEHQDGTPHYHMAVLLDRPTRWSRVRQHIQQTHAITVNFSGHGGYYSAYNYVKKEDRHVLYSDSHPDVVVKPKTYAATNVKVTKKMEKKGKRMGKLEVAELIVKNSIHDRIHLLQHANALRKEGQPALYKFCIERSTKTIVEFIATVWDAETAEQTLQRQNMLRMEILTNALDKPCICDRQWLKCATEVLERNGIDVADFSKAVKDLLQKGNF
eukprot:gene4042-biopygen2520